MKKVFAVIPAALLLCMVFSACGKHETQAQPLAKPPVAVEVTTATASDQTEGIEVTGQLEPKFSVDVRTQIPGLVKQVFVTEWVRVKKGQPLARIDLAETEAAVKRAEAGIASARANLARSEVTVTRAERELARMLKLKESGLATQQAVDDSRSEQEAAKAASVASRAQIRVAEEEARQAVARLAKGNVNSPIDGIVAMRGVNIGDLAGDAAAAKPIFRIVDNRLLNLTVTLSSADSGRIKIGQPLEFTVDSHPGKTFTGKVMFINPELSATDRSLKVVAEVNNVPETLKGGLFAKGRIVTGARTAILQTPRSAVIGLDLAARKGALFVVDQGTARKRDIGIGSINGEMIEITSGMKPGEQYVIRGGFNLKDGDRITVAAQGGAK